jgi:hypothetical protein
MDKEKSAPSSRKKKYDPVDCPNGMKEMCRAINAWATELYAWANEVNDRLWPPGGPGPTNPPPPPPFK